MPDHRQLVVQFNTTLRDRGRSDTASLQAAYPDSPVYNGSLEYNEDDKVKELFESLVIEGVVNDGGHTFGEFDRDYVEAPNLADVSTDSRGNEVSSPYAPSLASPPGGVDDWANQPATPEETDSAGRQSSAPFGGDALASPSDSSVNISRQTIGSLRKGESTPDS
jgi:hypothetical protein